MGHLKRDSPQIRCGMSGSGSHANVQQKMPGQAVGNYNLRPRSKGQVFSMNHDQVV